MHLVRRPLTLLALVVLVTSFGAPAAAQGREFAGSLVSVSGDAIVVEDRRGERVRFARGKDTVVEGKSGWDALAAGDRVVVKWSLADGPRRAKRVIVLGGGGSGR